MWSEMPHTQRDIDAGHGRMNNSKLHSEENYNVPRVIHLQLNGQQAPKRMNYKQITDRKSETWNYLLLYCIGEPIMKMSNFCSSNFIP